MAPPPADPFVVPARRRAAARTDAEQGHRVHRGGARRARPARAAAAPRFDAGRAGVAGARELPAALLAAREVHHAGVAAGPQRGAVLPGDHRLPRRDDADHLHADRRPRLPAVRPHLPQAARHLRVAPRPRPHRSGAAQLAAPRSVDDRGHRRRTHPRPGRPRRERHGHPDRQAVAVHRLRRHRSGGLPAGDARRRHQQRDLAQRPALRRRARAAAHRRGLRRVRRGVRRRDAGGVPRRGGPVRGLRQPQRVPAAREVPRPHLHVQRRHPGHGGGGRCRHLLGAAGHRQAHRGATLPVPRRRRGGGRHLRPAHAGAAPRPASPRPTRAGAASWSTRRGWSSRAAPTSTPTSAVTRTSTRRWRTSSTR